MDKRKKRKKKFAVCPFCGGELYWSSNAPAHELSDMYSETDTAMVMFMVCSRCGRDFEVFDPPESERESEYKEYWDSISKD